MARVIKTRKYETNEFGFDCMTNMIIECNCGFVLELWSEVTQCDSCERLYNKFGQGIYEIGKWNSNNDI